MSEANLRGESVLSKGARYVRGGDGLGGRIDRKAVRVAAADVQLDYSSESLVKGQLDGERANFRRWGVALVHVLIQNDGEQRSASFPRAEGYSAALGTWRIVSSQSQKCAEEWVTIERIC